MRMSATQRRAAIEHAATELFAQHGYAATTTDDIVTRAGVTKPMLYRHFESKRDLFMTLLQRHRDELADAPLQALLATHAQPFGQRLDAMLDAWFAHAEAHPFVQHLLHDTSDDPHVAELVAELHARQRAANIALIREFAPHIPERELPPLGEIIRSTLAGLARWHADHTEITRTDMIAAVRRTILGLGITNPNAL
jgi:AcrR family transcriptional regulator